MLINSNKSTACPTFRTGNSLRLRHKTPFQYLEWFLDPDHAADLCHRSASTVRRWIKGEAIDPACHELLLYKVFGLLPDPAFSGFLVRDGQLLTPTGRGFIPNELDQYGLMMAVYSDYERQIDALHCEVKRLRA